MKFFNLRKKLRNSTLAVLFALAVMFVMPATAFADDTDIIDNDTAVNVEVENGIDVVQRHPDHQALIRQSEGACLLCQISLRKQPLQPVQQECARTVELSG